MTNHRIDLSALTRAQLKVLADDVGEQLIQRENEERAALEVRLKALCEEHGFDGTAVRFAGNGKRAVRRTRKQQQTNGADDDQ